MTTWTQAQDGTLPVIWLEPSGYKEITLEAIEQEPVEVDCGYIVFQHGPVQEVGLNGTQIEVVLDALIRRLAGFQRGKFPNQFNKIAIDHMGLAAQALRDRTKERTARGVEGTNQR